MTMQSNEARAAAASLRSITGRDVATTAPARCAAYAAWSELTASPHDLDPRPALAQKPGIGATLPYSSALDDIVTVFVDADPDRLKAEYSGMFGVGSDGPPVPIREDLQTGQRAGTREELVRFYSHFGYSLDEQYAWAPDHLSVELEFMHFLCYCEASAADDATSFQLAQFDFAVRHLARWLPAFAGQVEKLAADSMYGRIMRGLNDFIDADLAWQGATITTVAKHGR